MVVGVITKSGTKYYLDGDKQVFWGGKFTQPTPFVRAEMLIGTRGLIYLNNGDIINTGEIVKYF